MNQAQPFWTVGSLARKFNTLEHRVRYVIQSRRIDHVGVAGRAFVYSDEAAEQIGAELNRLDRHSGRVSCD